MTTIIRAGFVSDANTYLNGIIKVEVESIADAVKVTSDFVDSLKKGWHVESVKVDDANDTIRIDVIKRD